MISSWSSHSSPHGPLSMVGISSTARGLAVEFSFLSSVSHRPLANAGGVGDLVIGSARIRPDRRRRALTLRDDYDTAIAGGVLAARGIAEQ
jgi:hypothetical protein